WQSARRPVTRAFGGAGPSAAGTRSRRPSRDAVPADLPLRALSMHPLSRRDVLRYGAATVAGGFGPGGTLFAEQRPNPRSVAAVVTIYTHNSHADVLLTKILEGWKHDGGPGPALKLASLYVDQFPDGDMARAMCRKHGVPL